MTSAEITDGGMALGVAASIILSISAIIIGLYISGQYAALRTRVDVLDDKAHTPLPPAQDPLAEADTDQFPVVSRPPVPPTVPENVAIDEGQAKLDAMLAEARASIEAIARGEK